MNISKFAKVLAFGASIGFGVVGSASAAFGGSCCQNVYQQAIRGCLFAGNTYSYCTSYYASDLNDCNAGTGVFYPLCND